MSSATITSKGQITIPKSIRERLSLETGDKVIFKIQGDQILFEKENTLIECPVCKGSGSFNINDLPCFICDQTAVINSNQSPWELIGTMKSVKYGVGVTITQQEFLPNGEIVLFDVPKVEVFSREYPKETLHIACDYLQIKFIEEYAPKNDAENFMLPSSVAMDDLLNLLKRDVAKEDLRKLFENH